MRQLWDLVESAPLRTLYAIERRWDLPESYNIARANLSREAWDLFSIGCDSGPIAKLGVAWLPISQTWADRFLAVLNASEPTNLRREDYSDGYFATLSPVILNFLNIVNDYRVVSPTLLAALREFLAEHGRCITQWLGHPWRISSVRQFNLRPITEPGSRHVDGWPPALRKMFILPGGASARSGTTWFRLRDGSELQLDHPSPCMVLFENNVCEHAMMPGPDFRPTIELNLVPARETSLEPVYAGINGWYPWFPEKGNRSHLAATFRISIAKVPT